jgi:hypothetical protein
MSSKFQQTLPFALLPISPALAALHASRARLLYPENTSSNVTHCIHCGTYLLHGDGNIRLFRHKQARFLQRSCNTCGWSSQVSLEHGNATLFPSSRKHRYNKRLSQRPDVPTQRVLERAYGANVISRLYCLRTKQPKLISDLHSRALKITGIFQITLQEEISSPRPPLAKSTEAG